MAWPCWGHIQSTKAMQGARIGRASAQLQGSFAPYGDIVEYTNDREELEDLFVRLVSFVNAQYDLT